MKLTKRQLQALYELWEAGYEHPVRIQEGEKKPFNALCKMGYAEGNPMGAHHFRITEKGILRLEDPTTLLVKEVTDS